MSSSELLEERYLNWLYRHVGPVGQKNPSRSHWQLALQMHNTEFIWTVPNDDNRVADGIDLRVEFVEEEEGGEYDQNWMDLGCSVLEMLIALSRRVAEEADRIEPYSWFWTFIQNLGMYNFTDRQYSDGVKDLVDETLYVLINRTYERDGRGGLFPLHNAEKDQRNVEIWYQMSAYLLENHE